MLKIGLEYFLKLSLSYRAWSLEQWQKERLCHKAMGDFETLDLNTLILILEKAQLRFFQSGAIYVDADFCIQRTIVLEAYWQGREHTTAFIEEVHTEMAHEWSDLENYFIDARPLQTHADGLEVEVWLLSKVKVNVYLQALQKKHVRLKALSIEGERGMGLNLLPWRQHVAHRHQYAVYLRVGLLPALVLLLAWSGLFYENSVFAHQQKIAARLNKQENQYLETHSETLTLGDTLPVLTHLTHVDLLSVNAQGQLSVSGSVTQPSEVSLQLQQFSEQAAVEPNSLHDLKVHEEHGQTQWQASFQLVRVNP